MRTRTSVGVLATLLWALAALAGHGVVAQAQEAGTFDISRAWLRDTTIFEPFYVTETTPLRQALADGRLDDETPLMVMEHKVGHLALVMPQLAYHHVAQGEMNGEPWMVSL